MTPGTRILVADDEPDLLQSVAAALRQKGAEVVSAESGAELITKMADEGPFALVIADVSMPWMSGLNAMHSARFSGLATPILVMTALTDPKIDEEVRALGRDALLLRKPFVLEELVKAVEALVSPEQPELERGTA
jgi:two-component system OmpR family response regulator